MTLFLGMRCQDLSLPWSSSSTRKQFLASASQSSRWKSSEPWRVLGLVIARDVVSWLGACAPPGSAPALVPQGLLARGVRVLRALPRLASLSGHIMEVST